MIVLEQQHRGGDAGEVGLDRRDQRGEHLRQVAVGRQELEDALLPAFACRGAFALGDVTRIDDDRSRA